MTCRAIYLRIPKSRSRCCLEEPARQAARRRAGRAAARAGVLDCLRLHGAVIACSSYVVMLETFHKRLSPRCHGHRPSLPYPQGSRAPPGGLHISPEARQPITPRDGLRGSYPHPRVRWAKPFSGAVCACLQQPEESPRYFLEQRPLVLVVGLSPLVSLLPPAHPLPVRHPERAPSCIRLFSAPSVSTVACRS